MLKICLLKVPQISFFYIISKKSFFILILTLERRIITFPKSCFYLFQWKPFKSFETFFLFLGQSSFCSWNVYIFAQTFSYVVKRFDKAKVDFKIYDATGQRINAIHILSNISRHKANKKLEFGQFITSIIKNNFLEKLYRKYYEEANRRPFNKKLNWTCVWMNSLKCLFLLYV